MFSVFIPQCNYNDQLHVVGSCFDSKEKEVKGQAIFLPIEVNFSFVFCLWTPSTPLSLRLWLQFEMELYQDEAVCQTPLDRQYHTEVKALNRARGRKNHRIFTYTDHDRYTNYLPFQQLVRCAASYVTPKSNKSNPGKTHWKIMW